MKHESNDTFTNERITHIVRIRTAFEHDKH